ncbi:hypothetical protein UA08_07190 [Talaromyces atroroseus]|uniref:FAD/NAD(P)-binding domain-containing protein n=1 Tax=Talaromyces atroroseus TaxID=1441469 RepID=A0A225AQF2_TALAT|nr:hypothetical protein UA08_07190 [Talaromyces atroroseus]OKL57839.1 hypothetical protein UA08_07190 [Talaromyces atroroseus]
MAEAIDTGFYFTSVRHTDTYPTINPSQQDLHNKYVFITGASKGIGRETALSYAQAGCAGIGIGARTDLSSLIPLLEQAAQSAGKAAPKVKAVTLDVTDEASVAEAAASIAEVFPRVDILINNAGYLEKRAKIAESDPSEWWKSWDVNVKGPYLVTRAFLPQMLERGGEKIIVNLCSIAAHLRSPGGSAYQTSKLAVLRLTEFLDVDHGPDGILTFAIHPGGVLTDMGRRLPLERQPALTESPRLCADSLVFLTRERREWLAGRYVSATWDVEELISKREDIVARDLLKNVVNFRYKRVAIVGAGPSGLAAVRALAQENCFEYIRIFERSDRVGGLWAFDPVPDAFQPRYTEAEMPCAVPEELPCVASPLAERAGLHGSIYEHMDTNAGAATMAFTDRPIPFANSENSEKLFGKDNSSRPRSAIVAYLETLFVPYLHYVSFNTTVEKVDKVGGEWVVTLRRSDIFHRGEKVDYWWQEQFDAVIVASGHHTIPFIPSIQGLEESCAKVPEKFEHSKSWRSAEDCNDKKVIIVGNNVSAADMVDAMYTNVKAPLYVSQRTPNTFFDNAWKLPNVQSVPRVTHITPGDGGVVHFADGSTVTDFDKIIFATGYKLSYPFLPFKAVTPQNRLSGFYQHIFNMEDPSLAVVGQIRAAITFRVFQYQSTAVACFFAGRSKPLPDVSEQYRWERERLAYKGPTELFHEIKPDFVDYYGWLREFAGMSTEQAAGELPPFQEGWLESDLGILFEKSAYWGRVIAAK